MGDVSHEATGRVILITGATGFIGRETVRVAREHGHKVCAVVRNAGQCPDAWDRDNGISVLVCDLAGSGAAEKLAPMMMLADAVIHAAAKMDADANGVSAASHSVMQALVDAQPAPARLVLVSSIAVYDTMRVAAGDMVDETTPLEAKETARDAYVAGKLAQEDLARDAAKRAGCDVWLMRPGAVMGQGHTWNAHLGPTLGPVLLSAGASGQVPVCPVDLCAEALVKAAETDAPDGIAAVNVVAGDLPDRAAYVKAHSASGWPRFSVPVSWKVYRALARVLASVQTVLPGLLRVPVVQARLMPLRYSSAKMQDLLGVKDDQPFADRMYAALEASK